MKAPFTVDQALVAYQLALWAGIAGTQQQAGVGRTADAITALVAGQAATLVVNLRRCVMTMAMATARLVREH
jgi:hypothetical protein